MSRDVHVSDHAVKRFRWRCSEGSPWPEFSSDDIKAWVRTMVEANAHRAKYYVHTNGYNTIAVPLLDEGCLLAVAICAQAKYPPEVVAVKTVYGPNETGWHKCESFMPAWWRTWSSGLARARA
jgi:hypothetical protein